jgi:recombination protein RecT
MTTTLANPPKQGSNLRNLLSTDVVRDQIAKALPEHLKPERFLRIAMTAITKTPKLADCTQESLMSCLLSLSSFGLEPDGRRAHLIPFGRDCTLIIDYKGLVELAMRSGIVANIHADVVRDNDVFEEDRGLVTKHKIDRKNPRGDVYAVYAVCRFKDGTEKAEVMDREEVESIRKRSRSGGSGPWSTDWSEMAKKTVFRRLSKWLPLSAEFRDALERDDDKLTERDITPRTVPGPAFEPESIRETGDDAQEGGAEG